MISLMNVWRRRGLHCRTPQRHTVLRHFWSMPSIRRSTWRAPLSHSTASVASAAVPEPSEQLRYRRLNCIKQDWSGWRGSVSAAMGGSNQRSGRIGRTSLLADICGSSCSSRGIDVLEADVPNKLVGHCIGCEAKRMTSSPSAQLHSGLHPIRTRTERHRRLQCTRRDGCWPCCCWRR